MSIAIPVRNGGQRLREVLEAVRAQRIDRPMQLLVADSGSTDGSRELARRHRAEIIDVAPGEFSHGGTRNLLIQRAKGTHIALLTQDSVPADDGWLTRLLDGFDVADGVGLVFGPYKARPDASLMVRRELDEWFASLPEVVRGSAPVGDLDDARRLFFTDANGCLARTAWDKVPFRPVAYAEDWLLSHDMLAAGYAKVYCRNAAVVHSHTYRPLDEFRRSFDEWRALREVNAVDATVRLSDAVLLLQRAVRDDLLLARREGKPGFISVGTSSLQYHSLRAIGRVLGSRAERLPAGLRRLCSLEKRSSYQPLGRRR